MPDDQEDKSFGAVEDKLCEAEFFLDQLRRARHLRVEAEYYFTAFISAARSVTWAMQASLSNVNGFPEWYADVQQKLRTDALAKFFVKARNVAQKRGHNPLDKVDLQHLHAYLDRKMRGDKRPILVVPNTSQPNEANLCDALEACESYFSTLVAVAYDCYDRYRTVVDARWYFTESNFRQQNKTIRDALAEMGFPPDWFDGIPDGDETSAWRVIRSQQAGCGINHLFKKYLGKEIFGPDDEAGSGGEKGTNYFLSR
jgi:hypothetical protein